MYFCALAAVLPVVLPVRNGQILRTVRVELVQPVRCYRIFLLYWDDSWGFGERVEIGKSAEDFFRASSSNVAP